MSAKTQPTKKAAPAKGGKPATKTPAKKAAKKAVSVSKSGKSPATKEQASKSGGKSSKPAAPVTPEKPGRKVITGNAAGTLPQDEIKNGRLRPREGTTARKLWDIMDRVRKDLGTDPARFQVMEAVKSAGDYNHDSISCQYFHWRTYHGIAGRSVKLFPKRNSYVPNVKEAPAPVKPPKKAAKALKGKPAAKATPPAPPAPVIPPPPVPQD